MDKPFTQSFSIQGKNYFEAGRAATEIKMMLRQLGIDPAIVRRVSIATYEAEMNVVMYAEEATLTVEVSPRKVKILVNDRGPGIPDVELAMQEGYSTATAEMREMGFGAGMGLPNIKKNSDELKITSTVSKGTTLEITININ